MRVIVIGGGILGLASARLIAQQHPDADVTLLEKERDVAMHQTGRNSGVVHAGLYYEPGSLKATLCRRGVGLLQAFCAEHAIAYDECGKVLVATHEDDLPRLERIRERAVANGVPGIAMLGPVELKAIEPHSTGVAALHSPSTAIVDYVAVSRAFAAELRGRGGQIRFGAEVVRIANDASRADVELADGTVLQADRVLVCAGLHADRLARASGQPASPRIIPFRGEYWALRPDREHLVRGLIYPVPDPSLPFLGVHLTRTVHGSVLVGPNAVLALAREGYRRRTVNLRDVADTLRWPGMWRLAVKHRRTAVSEIARSASRRVFVREARRYVPELRARDVVPAVAGVRAQAVDLSGALVDDFRLGRDRNVVWVRNAPSPAATSAMAIAEELVDRLELTSPLPVPSTP